MNIKSQILDALHSGSPSPITLGNFELSFSDRKAVSGQIARNTYARRIGCPKISNSTALPDPEAVAHDARRIYGDRAAEVLERQLKTIDRKLYDKKLVTVWRYAVGLLRTE